MHCKAYGRSSGDGTIFNVWEDDTRFKSRCMIDEHQGTGSDSEDVEQFSCIFCF